VLSGTGSNGTAGAQSVKAVGGLCVAQDPESAKFSSMPRSLIDNGLADAILRPGEMYDVIVRYAEHPYARGEARVPGDVAGRDRIAVNEIIALLRTRVRHDFAGYKKPTVLRRIQRRMSLLQTASVSDYVKALRQNNAEVTALADDLMIHVTGFFRDAEVWESLRKNTIEPLVAQRSTDAPIRCWVTACSSGEEAYTLGILLVEAAEAAGKQFDIKIFATDTAERSLTHARAGVYPGGIESDVTPERLARYFYKDDAFYHIKKELRELVVFAPQNVLQDPPFSRLDICTCRNFLIYIEPEVQRRVLAMLHFGLRENGTLMLGNSETVYGAEDLFEAVDKKHRIFRRVGQTRHGLPDFPLPRALRLAGDAGDRGVNDRIVDESQRLGRAAVAHLAAKVLLDQYTPAAVVVDRAGEIVYYHGNTAEFLAHPRGEPTRDLLQLVREELRGAVRSALHRAVAQGGPVHVRDTTFGDGDDRRRVEVTAAPLENRASSTYFIVSFAERPDRRADPADDSLSGDERSELLDDELTRVRDDLQRAVEELQSSNEEMRASHEESAASTRSCRARTKSSNEQGRAAVAQRGADDRQRPAPVERWRNSKRTTNDLASLLASADIAVVFLDTQFRIRRFTPATKDLFELIPADVGRPLSDLRRKFDDPALADDARAVLDHLVPREREIASEDGKAFVRRVLPYRTADNRIDGVVVTFVDITGRLAAETALRHSVEQHRLIVQSVQEHAIFLVGLDGRIASWNPGAQRVLAVHRRRGDRAVGGDHLHARGPRRRRARVGDARGVEGGPRHRRAVARPQGRQPPVGQREPDGPAQRRRHDARVRQNLPRRHRAQEDRGGHARQRGAEQRDHRQRRRRPRRDRPRGPADARQRGAVPRARPVGRGAGGHERDRPHAPRRRAEGAGGDGAGVGDG
jgi:two-component system CheB/CheR fusion protein